MPSDTGEKNKAGFLLFYSYMQSIFLVEYGIFGLRIQITFKNIGRQNAAFASFSTYCARF